MPRYAILAHDWPTPHFDLLLESGGVLKAWRLLAEPTPGATVPATPNADHRVHYLDYEGPVSGGRGTVTRIDSGEYEGDITGATWRVGWGDGVAAMTADGFTAPPQANVGPTRERGSHDEMSRFDSGGLIMLDGLDAVDWESLTHAYGPATDVPGLLRALLSPDQKVREEAVSELFGNIWHQGTVYPASAAAVPFLYELLTAPEVQDKPAIADLLTSIAEGVGYLEVHAVDDFGGPTWRKILSERGKTLEGELAREAAEIGAVHRAASAGLHHLVPFLDDPESEIRRSVASALGNYPEHEAWSLPALDAASARETDEDVREAIAASKARLSEGRT